MKIIIAGAGDVGTHLAKMLSGEKHDITLMDTDEEKLLPLQDNFDLMTVEGSSVSIAALKEAEVNNADLFIGVTPEESKNMTACLLAHSLGAKKTVARIDNAEYQEPKHHDFFTKLGINSLIYPEMLAARDIVDAIKMSWIRQWWEVDGGELLLIAVKVRKTATILNVPLHQLDTQSTPYLIVAVKRGIHTIIPRGSDCLQEFDLVYFMTMKKYLPYIRQITGKEDYKDVRNVMIMGGSRIAVRTAKMAPDYMKIKIIEQDLERCNRLTELLDDRIMIINGDGRDMDLLIEEGIENTEAFIALTGNAETNILACLAAKRTGVSKTVAEVENMTYISMAESMDIGTIINKKLIAASHIYQLMMDDSVSNVKCLAVSNADVAEFIVKEGAKVTRHPVKDCGLPHGVNIGGVIRKGTGMLVNGNTQIMAGDHVVVFCTGSTMQKMEKYWVSRYCPWQQSSSMSTKNHSAPVEKEGQVFYSS